MQSRFSTTNTEQSLDADLERIIEAALDGLQHGKPIDVEALAAAHPTHDRELRDLLPMMASLLQFGERTGATTTMALATSRRATLPAHQQLGDFRLIREIGRGGMGIVYEAEQLSMGRRVALKVLPFTALVDDKSLQRFRNEVRAAAALDHPHIVSVYSIGEDRGVHFYAMQLVRGQSLAEVIEGLRSQGTGAGVEKATIQSAIRNPQAAIETRSAVSSALPATPSVTQARSRTAIESRRAVERFRAAARLGIQAAEALQHAHDQGVLHRDIKPGNLLLDATVKVYVTDFGLARIEAEAGLTMTGDVLGTLRYMAPEQASGKHVVIDHRADIYSLGATLYELLALQPAFGETDRTQLLKQIAVDEPQPLTKIDQRIPLELETIVAKAMAKQPEERYETAQQLADDLQAFLEDRPIHAKPPTIVQRTAKWSRRHQKVVASAALFLVLLTAILAVSIVLINRARTNALAALKQTNDLLYTADIAEACQAWEKGWADEARQILDRQRPSADGIDRRGFDWHLLHGRVIPPQSIALVGHKGPVYELAVFPDLRRLASVGQDATLRIWDIRSGRLLKSIELGKQELYSVAVSPDGRYVAAGSGWSTTALAAASAASADGSYDTAGVHTVYLCDLHQDDAVRAIFPSDHSVEALAFSPDGQRLAAGLRYTEVCLLWLDGKVIQRIPCTARIESLQFAQQSPLLLMPNRRPGKDNVGVLQVWRDDLSKLEREFDDSSVSGPARFTVARLSPDERFLAVGEHYRSRTQVFDFASGQIVAETAVSRDNLTDLAYAPDGKTLAVGYVNGAVELFDLQTGTDKPVTIRNRPKVFNAHSGTIHSMRFIDARTLASAGEDGHVAVWKLMADADRALYPETPQFDGMQLSPDGSRLLHMGKRSLVIDANTGRELHSCSITSAAGGGSAWSPAGDKIVYCPRTSGRVSVDDREGQSLFAISHGHPPNAAAFSPNERYLAVISDRYLQLCDADSGSEIFRISLPDRGGRAIFDHFGDRLAYGGFFGKIAIMNVPSGRPALEWLCASNTACLAFSPDDSLLATGHGDAVIRIWDALTGRLRAELVGHEQRVADLAFAPDGHTLLSAGDDGTVRLWSVLHSRGCGVVYRDPDSACRISLSADGRRLAIGHKDDEGRTEVLLWDIDD